MTASLTLPKSAQPRGPRPDADADMPAGAPICDENTPMTDAAAPEDVSDPVLDAVADGIPGAGAADAPALAVVDPGIAHASPVAPVPLPDRLSVDPRSRHHVATVFERGIGIRLNDKERFDVEEYCISEGWVKVPAGKTRDRKGNPLLITLKGRVEAFYR